MPNALGVDRFGPAWLSPEKSRPGDWILKGGEWVSTGVNPLYGPAGTIAGSNAATSGNVNDPNGFQGTGGGVPVSPPATSYAPGTQQDVAQGSRPTVQRPESRPQPNALAAPPPNPWQEGAAAHAAATNATQGGDPNRAAVYNAQTRVQNRVPGANTGPPPTGSIPGLPGDTATGGYVDPATGLWVERNVGTPLPLPNVGTAAPPGATAGPAPGVSTSHGWNETPVPMPTPTATAGPDRTAVYNHYNQNQSQGQAAVAGRADQLTPPAATGGNALSPSNNLYPFPQTFNYDQVQDYSKNPAYQSRLQDSENQINRYLNARGRSNSTFGVNALSDNARHLGAEFENQNYQRAFSQNQTQYNQALEINKLLYDRQYQTNVLNYEREFRENERMYGRAQAEEILAYERSFREDARDYDRAKYLVEVGLRATGAPAA